MRTSEDGIAFLEAHEGEVLKAYRCPAGIWTIGAGLTKGSGVVAPRAGMRITKAEASDLLAKALARNYEPRVAKAMPGASQHAFDGGVSFDFNTGAIHRASWVKAWVKGDRADARRRLGLWNKGGGKVLAGLVRRRREEADLILDGAYGKHVSASASELARVVIPLDAEDVRAVREQFRTLGYDPGSNVAGVSLWVVREFQRDHDLSIDGIIGKATLSTLQRRIDARRKPLAPAATVATGTGAANGAEALGIEELVADLPPDLVGWGLAILGVLWLGKTGTDYRDVIAAKIQGLAPGAAAFLRSF